MFKENERDNDRKNIMSDQFKLPDKREFILEEYKRASNEIILSEIFEKSQI